MSAFSASDSPNTSSRLSSGRYRPNVGIIVARSASQVLYCARADQPDLCWQFPQGGIDSGESPLSAAYRELYEETGLTAVKLIAALPQPLRYDFPPPFRLADYIGQEQHWFLFALTTPEPELNFAVRPEEIEFKASRWDSLLLAPALAVSFKREVYAQVAAAFQPLLTAFYQGDPHGL